MKKPLSWFERGPRRSQRKGELRPVLPGSKEHVRIEQWVLRELGSPCPLRGPYAAFAGRPQSKGPRPRGGVSADAVERTIRHGRGTAGAKETKRRWEGVQGVLAFW
jgi:hypothetical protein